MRFPRDWLGPLDELVPLGPAARQDSDAARPDEAASADGPAEGRVVDLTPPAPIRAEDFWGEDSAAIHDALEPPPQAEAATVVATRSSQERRITSLRRHVPAIPRRVGHRVAAPEEHGSRRRAAWITAISAIAVAIISAALAVAGLRGEALPQVASRGDGRGFTSTALAALPSDVTAVARLGRRHLNAFTSARPRIRRQRRPASAPARDRAAHPATRASAPTPSAPSSPRPHVYVQTAQATPPSRSSGRSTPAVVEAQRPTTGSSSTSGGGTHSSAPVASAKRPAFGANGLLGPGSSPNS